jgi:glycosyltransferase involved in cell wall biosynthesis
MDAAKKLIMDPVKILRGFKEISRSDLIWAWFADYPVFPLIIAAKIFGVPSVVNVGGFEVSAIPEIKYGNQLKRIRGAVSLWIARNASSVIIPSPSYAQKIRHLEPSATVVMIPNWIDTSICNKPLPEKKQIAVTSVCSQFAYKYKGIPVFKAAAKCIPYETKITEHLPRMEYEKILSESKVYCQLSRDETFGISLVEAMAYGCVPVVSDKGALPWIVGNTGIIIPYGDPIATAEAIKKAMCMDGKAARDRAGFFNKEKKRIAVKKLILSLVN